MAAPVQAQLTSTIGGVQTRIAADPNGVDLVTGSFNFQRTDLTFGPNAQTHLALMTQHGSGPGDNYRGRVYLKTEGTQDYAYAVHGNRTEKFRVLGSTYVPVSGNGATLAKTSSTTYLLTEPSGVKIEYYHHQYSYTGFYHGSGTITYINYILYPDKEKLTLSTKVDEMTWCEDWLAGASPAAAPVEEATEAGGTQLEAAFIPPYQCYKQPIWRVQSITSNLGYQLRFGYAEDAVPSGVPDPGGFPTRTSATAVNLAIDYCDPAASTCTYTKSWPTLTYSTYSVGPTPSIAYTDPNGGQWSIIRSYSGGTQTVSVKRPSSATPYIVATITSSKVSSVQTPGGTWQYSYVDSGSTRTTTVTDPANNTRVVVSNLTTGLITSDTNEAGKTTQYQYDTSGRMTKVIYPEDNYTQYTYDTRGNVTQTRQVSKTPGTPADIVTTASYPSTCANVLTCNQPTWTRDARNQQTDYTYDPNHGGVLTVTAPAPTSGAVRPQTRYTYSALQAWYKNAAGTLIASGSPVYRLTTVSACRTTASCAGAADESRTTVAYEAGSSSSKSNLLPKTVSRGTGANPSLTVTSFGYDDFGNLTSVDGPLSGTADATHLRYGTGYRLLGVIAPDPDDTGTAKYPATRYSYDSGGQLYRTDSGTVNGLSDTDWANFVSTGNTLVEFDSHGRPIRQKIRSGSTSYRVTDTVYGTMGRVQCSIVRMTPASWGTVASSCSPPQAGDRVTYNHYDALGRVWKVTTGYGTGVAASETSTFTANGRLKTLTDSEGNKTTYEYDGHDRLMKTRFPHPTTAGTSSTTDYERVTYDKNGNVTSFRTRRGETLHLYYDNLDRLIKKVVPQRSGLSSAHTRDVYFGYDLLGDMTYARFDSASGQGITNTFNALGQLTGSTIDLDGQSRQLSYQYDAAGNRTRLTHPDGNYVQYIRRASGAFFNAKINNSGLIYPVLDTVGRPYRLYRNDTTAGVWTNQYTQFGYDAISRVSSLTTVLPGTAYDSTTTFTYNPASQIASSTRSNDAYAWNGHVNVNRNYTANGLNQYTAIDGLSGLAYDANGNLTSDGANTYVYDVENRLVSRDTAGTANDATLRYDPLGRLYEVDGGTSGITRFLYDGGDLVAEYNSAGTLLRRYVHGPSAGDDPLVWFEGASVASSARRYLYADERGSIVAVTNATGSVLDLNTYDEYGIPGSSNGGRFQYTGQAWIPELGMYYYKARMYSPTLGRFMQTDPIGYGDGTNMYAYVGSDPVNFVDPTGMARVLCGTFSRGYTTTEFVGGEWITSIVVIGYEVSCGGMMHGLDGIPDRDHCRGLRGPSYRACRDPSWVPPSKPAEEVKKIASKIIDVGQAIICYGLSKLPDGTSLSLSADVQAYGGIGGYLGASAFVDNRGNTGLNFTRGWGAGLGAVGGAGVAFGSTPAPGRTSVSHIQGGVGIGLAGASTSYSKSEGWNGSAGISAGPKLGYAAGSVEGISSTVAGGNICK